MFLFIYTNMFQTEELRSSEVELFFNMLVYCDTFLLTQAVVMWTRVDISAAEWLLLMFSLWKRHILSKEEGKNISLFNYPQLLHLSHPPQVSFPRRRDAFHCMAAALLLFLLLSSQKALLCMKHRGRLKAFTGHSDNEERRSSELY